MRPTPTTPSIRPNWRTSLLVGDWKDLPYDLRIDAIELHPPTPAQARAAQARAAELAAEREKELEEQREREAAKQKLLAKGRNTPTTARK